MAALPPPRDQHQERQAHGVRSAHRRQRRRRLALRRHPHQDVRQRGRRAHAQGRGRRQLLARVPHPEPHPGRVHGDGDRARSQRRQPARGPRHLRRRARQALGGVQLRARGHRTGVREDARREDQRQAGLLARLGLRPGGVHGRLAARRWRVGRRTMSNVVVADTCPQQHALDAAVRTQVPAPSDYLFYFWVEKIEEQKITY